MEKVYLNHRHGDEEGHRSHRFCGLLYDVYGQLTREGGGGGGGVNRCSEGVLKV